MVSIRKMKQGRRDVVEFRREEFDQQKREVRIRVKIAQDRKESIKE